MVHNLIAVGQGSVTIDGIGTGESSSSSEIAWNGHITRTLPNNNASPKLQKSIEFPKLYNRVAHKTDMNKGIATWKPGKNCLDF